MGLIGHSSRGPKLAGALGPPGFYKGSRKKVLLLVDWPLRGGGGGGGPGH